MSLQDIFSTFPEFQNDEILKTFVKGYSIINNPTYRNIVCSISGGSDSDVVLDIISKIDESKKVKYVWFNTGLEYKATKEHLKYLESKYGIQIKREKAIKPIPLCCAEYGQPFISKRISEMISRLQRHGFKWEDESFDVLYKKYPKCKAALKWWCNEFGVKSKFNIERKKYLKEFMIENPPTFKISGKCCDYAKKAVIHKILSETDADLNIFGVRKSEGGARQDAYKNCYSVGDGKIDQYRPIFWFKEKDKSEYEKLFKIVHSDCYTQYGLKRTGCTCCPFALNLNQELEITKNNEPLIYKAVNKVFGDSYEYTRQYKEFCRKKDAEKKNKII